MSYGKTEWPVGFRIPKVNGRLEKVRGRNVLVRCPIFDP